MRFPHQSLGCAAVIFISNLLIQIKDIYVMSISTKMPSGQVNLTDD